MGLLEQLADSWKNITHPFLIHKGNKLKFEDILSNNYIDLSGIKSGDVVALIGDYDVDSITTLIKLIDIGAIVLPLTSETLSNHEYFFETSFVDIIINGNKITKRENNKKNELIQTLRDKKHPGIILFTTGTTNRPKAILHDFTSFIEQFKVPHSSFKTINFMMFDHIGGINMLFHTLFHKGTVIAPEERTVNSILNICDDYGVEVLPVTPTFLRMLLISEKKIPECIKIITYGAEQMDQFTLSELCNTFKNVDFRQTFGMSELGAIRAKSERRDSLFMQLGGDGVETKVVDSVLYIKSKYRMVGYLNSSDPFDKDGWFNTRDTVETKGKFIRITGRIDDVINVGGLKFKKSEVEHIALSFKNVLFAKLLIKQNPITGQHIELIVEPKKDKEIDKAELASFLKEKLPSHMIPRRISIKNIDISHRFKRL